MKSCGTGKNKKGEFCQTTKWNFGEMDDKLYPSRHKAPLPTKIINLRLKSNLPIHLSEST